MMELKCPHAASLGDENSQVHYCSYIGVPLIQSILENETEPRRLMIRAAAMTTALWFKVMRLDLTRIERNLHKAHGSDADTAPLWDALKLTRRGVALGKLLTEQSFMLESNLGAPVVEPTDPLLIESWQIGASVAQMRGLISQPLLGSPQADFVMMAEQLGDALTEWQTLLMRLQTQIRHVEDASFYKQQLSHLVQHADSQLTSEWHDETMFIVVHEATEGWFYVIIQQLLQAIDILNQQPERVWEAVKSVRQAATIQALMAQQIQLPLTMLPSDFLQFRSGLGESSGLESVQFRQLELVAGLRDEVHMHRLKVMGKSLRLFVSELQDLVDKDSLALAFRAYLKKRGLIAPEATKPEEIAESLRHTYQTPSNRPNPDVDVMALAEEMVQFERNLRLWRDAHVGMVAQMIGSKPGTGYSSGLAYLRQTMNYDQLYPELWQVRTLIRKED